MWGVMGRRCFGGVEVRERFKPFSMYASLGKEAITAGSGRPAEIWRWRTAARYDFTDAG